MLMTVMLLAQAVIASADVAPRELTLTPPTWGRLALDSELSRGAEASAPERLTKLDGLAATHRVAQWITLGLLATTGAGGVIAAINQPTLFGDGRCTTEDPLLGTYGCDGFSILHGALGVASLVGYTTTRALGWALEDAGALRLGSGQRLLSWIHLVGMVLQPVLGLAGARPQVLGLTDPQRAQEFARTLRTIHVAVGVVTVGTFAATTLLRTDF